nr:hypothetical protein BaRGS_001974 [Batillaria attramentaria]
MIILIIVVVNNNNNNDNNNVVVIIVIIDNKNNNDNNSTSINTLKIECRTTMLKAFCAGLPFFKRKLETFDLFIVVVSFVVDVVFMQILPRFKIQDFVFILAFLLPWRVIRVVDSLVVAVQDHEHFRLKLLYSRKKKIQNSLRETEVKLQLFKAQCCALKRLCINEGVEESKIEQIVQLDEYVVNRTGKSKCKVRIDNASVILLDKSDFPRLSPRPSLANLLEKRRSIQVDSARDPKCDKLLKRNGHSLAVGDAIRRDSVCVPAAGDSSKGKRDGGGWKGKGWRPFWDNGPRASKIPEESLLGVTKVKRAGSQSQIYDAPKRDLRSLLKISSAEGGVKRAGSQSQICHVTINPSASDFAENVVKRQASSDLSEDAVVVHTANDKAGGEEVGIVNRHERRFQQKRA